MVTPGSFGTLHVMLSDSAVHPTADLRGLHDGLDTCKKESGI